MTYSTFQGKLPVVNFLEFENKLKLKYFTCDCSTLYPNIRGLAELINSVTVQQLNYRKIMARVLNM